MVFLQGTKTDTARIEEDPRRARHLSRTRGMARRRAQRFSVPMTLGDCYFWLYQCGTVARRLRLLDFEARRKVIFVRCHVDRAKLPMTARQRGRKGLRLRQWGPSCEHHAAARTASRSRQWELIRSSREIRNAR